jgi:hypothetical protein
MSCARLVACALVGLGSLGCTVTAVSAGDDPRPSNVCQSDSDCSSGSCGAGVCQAVNGQIEGLLVSVTPPSDSTVPHLTFVTQLEDVPTSGGEKNIELSGPSHVKGSLVMPERSDCYPFFLSNDPERPIFGAPDGQSLPVQVTFELRERLLGVPQQLYVATTPRMYSAQGSYFFDVNVPPGQYDVYLVPPRTSADCPVPPQLRRGWTIKGGDFAVPFRVASVSSLSLRVRWPNAQPTLVGWVADIIEPLGGKTISTEAVLRETAAGNEYEAALFYSDVVAPEATEPMIEAASDLVRLRPPHGVVAPTIYFDRSALGLFGADAVTLKDFTKYPPAVRVEGQVARGDDGAPVSGSVTLISTAISGMEPGVFASFQTTASVDDSGVFEVELPPGSYRVQAVPPLVVGGTGQRALAAFETTWEIPGDVAFQAGKLLELRAINELTGQSRFQGAQVQAVPTPLTVLPFEKAFGMGDFLPRATSGLVDEAGRFVVRADPGKFDVTVQAPESLGFAWYVHPGVVVQEGTQDLGAVNLPVPVAVTGTASISVGGQQQPIPSAAVRAYAYLDKDLAYTRDPKQAVSVVQVAETRADERGVFRLLVPSSITASN